MTLRAGLPPKKFFRLGHSQRDPFLCSENSRGCGHRLLGKISIWRRHAKLRRMAGDVLLKFLKKECVNYGGGVVRDLLLKARVKLQSMASAAMFCVSDRYHVRAACLPRRRNILRVQLCWRRRTKFPRFFRTSGAMAILAIQLNGAVGAFQIMAQMNCVVQLDCPGI